VIFPDVCGRFTVLLSARAVASLGVTLEEALPERYNVAPSQMVPVVRLKEGKRELVGLRWGLRRCRPTRCIRIRRQIG